MWQMDKDGKVFTRIVFYSHNLEITVNGISHQVNWRTWHRMMRMCNWRWAQMDIDQHKVASFFQGGVGYGLPVTLPKLEEK